VHSELSFDVFKIPRSSYKELLIYFGVLLSFIVCLFFNPYTYYWSDRPEAYYFYLFSLAIFVYFFVMMAIDPFLSIKLTKIDLLISALLISCLISSMVNRFFIHNEQLLTLLYSFLIYLVIRCIRVTSFVVITFNLFIAGCMVLQLVVGSNQLEFQSADFSINQILLKGKSDNSGLFAIFITLSSCVILNWKKNISSNVVRILFTATIFVVTVCVVLITGSRSALLSVVSILCFFIFSYNSALFSSIRAALVKRFWLTAIAACLVVAFILFLFFYKTNSSLGRFFIWRISLLHYLENPIIGIGYGSFPIKYHGWQADFFSSPGNLKTSFVNIADINYEMFNEPLQMLIETGVIGLLIFGYLAYRIGKAKLDPAKVNFKEFFLSMKGVLVGCMASSLFSYPFHSTPILILTIICLGLLVNLTPKRSSLFNISSLMRTGWIILSFMGIAFFLHFYSYFISVRLWHKNAHTYSSVSRGTINHNILPAFYNNGILLNNYAEKLFQNARYEESISVMALSKRRFINENTFILLGLSHQKLKEYDKSEEEFLFLKSLVPNRFRPNYFLVQLYLERGDSIKAKQLAKEIIKMPVKVESPEVYDIKRYMENLLK
jgi:O-antigen polymerase